MKVAQNVEVVNTGRIQSVVILIIMAISFTIPCSLDVNMYVGMDVFPIIGGGIGAISSVSSDCFASISILLFLFLVDCHFK